MQQPRARITMSSTARVFQPAADIVASRHGARSSRPCRKVTTMSDLIPFPSKQVKMPENKTPEQALTEVLEHLQTGSTRADNMIIMWSHEDNEASEYRFMLGGNITHSQSIGLLEITKDMFLHEE